VTVLPSQESYHPLFAKGYNDLILRSYEELGLLLMLSPWEHHNDKRKLTAQQCTELNLMALDIAQA